MRDWIVGLVKTASDWHPGATPEQLREAEGALELPLPEELQELYGAMDGADLPGDISLFRLRQSSSFAGVVEQSRSGLTGLPARGLVRFGLRGGADHLFAARPGELLPFLSGAQVPPWLSGLPADGWVFGVKNPDLGAVELFRSLEELFKAVVPPPPVDGFGENTFVRAMSAVQSALGEVQKAVVTVVKKATGAAAKRRPKNKPAKAKRPAARKPPAKKATTKKAATKKAAAKKKTTAAKKRPASKKPAKRKAAPRRPARR